jgi:hypothetical protein
VDDLTLVFLTELAGQPPRRPAHQARDLLGVVVHETPGDGLAAGVGQVDRVPGVELALDPDDAGRQQRGTPLHDGLDGAGVEFQAPPGDRRVCQPQQPGPRARPGRREVRPGRLARERLPGFPGGGHYRGDARRRGDQRRLHLGRHAPGAHAALARLADPQARQVIRPADVGDARGTALAGIAVVQAVHIRQQDQRVCPGHVGDERRQPVVVAEPDLVRGDRVVLVDDRDGLQLEQALERALGVAVMAPAHEVVGGEQHLAGLDAAAGERRRIASDQEALTHAGRGLLRR